MERKYVALYREGGCEPLGAIRTDIAEDLVADMKRQTGKNYWTKPITAEEAEKIKQDITRCSPGVEALLQDKKE